MQKNKFDIKTGERFPWQFLLLAVVFIVISIFTIGRIPLLAAVLSFLALLIFTARGGLEIDMDNQTYREYMSFLFLIRIGKPVRFHEIENIFINSGTVNQKMYTAHTTQSLTSRKEFFNVFIKFSNGEKIKIASNENKDQVKNYASALANRISSEVVDYTAAN